MRSPLLRIVIYMASSTPACNSTAMPVRAMNTVSLSIVEAPGYVQDRAEGETAAARCLQILTRSCVRSGFVIGLASCLVRSPELFLLGTHNFAASICPLRSLISRFARTALHIFTAFFGTSTQDFAGLAAGARRVEHARERAQPKSC